MNYVIACPCHMVDSAHGYTHHLQTSKVLLFESLNFVKIVFHKCRQRLRVVGCVMGRHLCLHSNKCGLLYARFGVERITCMRLYGHSSLKLD